VANIVQGLYAEAGEKVEIIDLVDVGLDELPGAAPYGEHVPPKMKKAIEKINGSDGIIVVCPEYNGSMPGALKYFIDHWTYPDSYEYRPIALIGLGARFGALRPVEHLQGVFGYRNAFIYPERVFMIDVMKVMDTSGKITDTRLLDLMRSQVRGFQAFARALAAEKLDANSRIEARKSLAAAKDR
jgi:NAD(P)H-dependent FMN reductase